MSNFFRSAAMSLLSKTLQTLLYKYLSDVDVEGVALPSLYQDGWGVRLKNVKLRPGATLMRLKRPTRTRRSNLSKKRNQQQQQQQQQQQMPSMDSVQQEPVNDNVNHTTTTSSSGTRRPVTKRSSSWFRSWYSSTTTTNHDNVSRIMNHDDDNSHNESLQQQQQQQDASSSHKDEDSPLTMSQLDPPTAQHVLEEETTNDIDNDDTTTRQYSENNTQQQQEKPPWILRLGKNGQIGVLDVRLVEKNIHVFVQDASLTMEITSSNDDNQDDNNNNNNKKDSLKKQETVRNRVLAENAIARIFSALPNLLLRDIRIRVIVRGTQQQQQHEDVLNDNDTVLEFGIELLSVTNGQDFLAQFQAATTSSSNDQDDDDKDHHDDDDETSDDSSQDSNVFMSQDQANEFEMKRIRTGRGPEGGITLKIYSGQSLREQAILEKHQNKWARQQWQEDTDKCLLRISGLDVHARIFKGEQESVVDDDDDFFFDDFSVDTMLFGGVDYIAPGPKPPLPPMLNKETASTTQEHPWTIPGAMKYVTDANGIQRSGVASCFHRVARGMRPSVCRGDHVPCEHCDQCWTSNNNNNNNNSLDASIPMGGLLLHASLRDCLEINVDRQSLETIGLILDLFRKENVPETVETDSSIILDTSERTNLDESARSTRSFFSRGSAVDDTQQQQRKLASSSILEETNSNSSTSSSLKAPVVNDGNQQQDITQSYPSYFQPEKIQIYGLYISGIRLRLHALRSNEPDNRFSFCYWDLHCSCLTMDLQRLTAQERPFSDIRMDAGYFQLDEYSGIHHRQLLSLGTRHPTGDMDTLSSETMISRESSTLRSAWPSVASALMDIPPPLESLVYESRERHAVQIRYCTVLHRDMARDQTFASLYAQLGSVAMDMPRAVKDAILTAKTEMLVLVQQKQASDASTATEMNVDEKEDQQLNDNTNEKRLKYKIKVDGGRARMDPWFDISIPVSTFGGERSSLAGISLETVLHNAKIAYKEPAPCSVLECGLSLEQIASLPESVRLRVLLFLSDLQPLEVALGIKQETNSFLRCRSVNKGLVEAAKRSQVARQQAKHNHQMTRAEVMAELMNLDDSELASLWESYQLRKEGKFEC